MATATKKYQSYPVDAPAAHVAYAFENVGSINIVKKDGGSEEKPLRSSLDGRIYTVFFDDRPERLSLSGADVMEAFQDENIEVVFPGYWYRNGLINRWDRDGNEERSYRNFEKQLARTDNLLNQIFQDAFSAQAAAEPKIIEVPVPMRNWLDIVRTMISTALIVWIFSFILALVS